MSMQFVKKKKIIPENAESINNCKLLEYPYRILVFYTDTFFMQTVMY